MKLHIRTFAQKMPPVGLERETSTYAAQAVTQLTKWADGAKMKLHIVTFAPKDTRASIWPGRHARFVRAPK